MDIDEKTINADWGENCYLNFLEKVQSGDYVGAKDCIRDMHDIFPKWADKMQKELDNTPISTFAIESYYYAL